MKEKKEKIRGIIGTITFHVILLILLIFLGFSTPLPLPGEEGVEVSLGYDDGGYNVSSEDLPQNSSPPEKEKETEENPVNETSPENLEKSAEEVIEEDYITDNNEDTPSIEDLKEKNEPEEEEKNNEEQQNEEEINKQQDKPEESPPEETEKKQNKPRSTKHIYKGPKQTDDGSDKPEGDTDQPGSGGIPNGSKDVDNKIGEGGMGNGISYNLGGRGAKNIPIPPNDSELIGYIVVSIKVNREGKVITAKAGVKGTTIFDLELQKLVERYAKQAEFKTATKTTPEFQVGTITYKFVLGK